MADIWVEPGSPNPPFDLILDDGHERIGLIAVPDADALGRNPVEQSSLKTSTGDQKFSDLQPPYTTISQVDWTGGRAAAEFEKDTTRYHDGLRANTERATGVIMGGRETYSTGLRPDLRNLPGSMRLIALTGDRRFLARRFQADANMNAEHIWVWVRRKGTPKGALTAKLREDDGGDVGDVLQSKTLAIATAPDLVSDFWIFDITTNALVAATYYWVEVMGASGDNDLNHWEVGVLENIGVSKKSADGISYISDDVDLYCRVTDNDGGVPGILFQYKKAQYFVDRQSNGSASHLWLNGARGLAASNAGQMNKLICSTGHGLSDNEAVGAIILVIEGLGFAEEQNWRSIIANDATTFTVDEDWLIEQNDTTAWVVLGLNKWNDLGAVGNKPVTDVHVSSQGIVYFCHGELTIIHRMKEEISGGAWTRSIANEATKAVFMTEYYNTGLKLVRTNEDGTASEAPVPTTWTDITGWTTPAVAVGDKYDRITGVEKYKDYNLDDAVTIFKEAGPWLWKNEIVDEMRTKEMATVANARNGCASTTQGVYLFFSVLNTVWRFYHPTFDDVGPTNDQGLPVGRQGPVSAIVAYPGRVIIAVDGGDDGYSAVFTSPGSANFCEIYRAPKGERIRALDFQVIPGGGPDHLWVRQGADILHIPYPSDTYDPFQDANYPFAHEFVLEFASISASLYTAWKYWKKLQLRTKNLIENEVTNAKTTWLEADYRLSEDDDWVTFPDEFTESDVQEQEFNAEYGISSQILYLRIRGYSVDTTKSPKLTAAAISGVTVVEPKFSYQLQIQMLYRDKNGHKEDIEPFEKVRKLDEWCGAARPLRLYTTNPLFHNKKVFLMPLPVRPIASAEKVNEHEFQCSIILQEA
jgi:hypothetical protein